MEFFVDIENRAGIVTLGKGLNLKVALGVFFCYNRNKPLFIHKKLHEISQRASFALVSIFVWADK